MMDSRIKCYRLDSAAIKNLAASQDAELTPVLVETVESTPFTALDCFDQSLRRSDRLLLQTDTAFILLDEELGILIQSAAPDVRFLDDFANGPVKRALKGLSPLRSLLPIGTGNLELNRWAFVDDQEKTHCRANAVRLRVPKRRGVALLGVEGVRGYADSLVQLQAHIARLGGMPCDGAALLDKLFPEQSGYQAKPDIDIATDERIFDAANRIIATCIAVVRANEFGIIADHDTEFLHDYRIQLRKIRSILSLFKGVYSEDLTAELKTRFSAVMAPTGPLRDFDVYLLDKQKYYDLLPDSLHDGLNTLFATLTQHRETEQNKLTRHLRSAKYQREISDLEARFANPQGLKPGVNADLPAYDYACDLIWKRYRRVSRVASQIGPHTPDVEIHDLRIHCKKLRYLMEFFGPMFPKAAFRRLLKPLKLLQDNLGLFNDYSVQQESLRAFSAKATPKRGDAQIEAAQSLGALISVLHQLQLDERAKVMANLGQFNSPKVQQFFSELFQKRESHA